MADKWSLINYLASIQSDDPVRHWEETMETIHALRAIEASGAVVAGVYSENLTFRTSVNHTEEFGTELLSALSAIVASFGITPIFNQEWRRIRRMYPIAHTSDDADGVDGDGPINVDVDISNGAYGPYGICHNDRNELMTISLSVRSYGHTLFRGDKTVCDIELVGPQDTVQALAAALTSHVQPYMQPSETDIKQVPPVVVNQVFMGDDRRSLAMEPVVQYYSSWNEVRDNYDSSILEACDELVATPDATDKGAVIILHGPTGTGKTHFLRTLFREWRKKYTPLVIQDVEYFMTSEYYFMNLMGSTRGDANNKRPLIVLEDAGQGVIRNGQLGATPIQRLLNRSDGLCVGDRGITFVITFNENIGEIDEAVVRAGRCRAKILFPNINKTEAESWARTHIAESAGDTIEHGMSIADLYALKRGYNGFATDAAHPAGTIGFCN